MSNQLVALREKTKLLQRKKGFCLWSAFGLKTKTSTLAGIPSLPAHHTDFRLASPHNNKSHFLEISIFLLLIGTVCLQIHKTSENTGHTAACRDRQANMRGHCLLEQRHRLKPETGTENNAMVTEL